MNYSGCENSLLLNEVAEMGWIFSIFSHRVKITYLSLVKLISNKAYNCPNLAAI